MKLKLNTKMYLEKEFYIGAFSVILGIFLMNAPDRNEGLYLIYPKIMYGGLLVIGIIMLLTVLTGKGSHNIVEVKIGGYELSLMLLIMFVRPAIGNLGLYTTLFMMNVIVSLMIEKDKNRRTILRIIVFNLILITVFYLIFAILLNVSTPKAWLI